MHPRRAMRCCCAVLDAAVRAASGSHDTAEQLRTKRIVCSIIILTFPVWVMSVLTDKTGKLSSIAAELTGMGAGVITFGGWLVDPRLRMEAVYIGGGIVSTVLADYHGLSQGDRFWSPAVIAMDLALVLNVEERYTRLLLSVLVLYLVFVGADRAGFGLYRHFQSDEPWICDCADPPCPQRWHRSFVDVFVVVIIFVLDFYLTRGFAKGMRDQMAVIQNAIEVTEEIASQLCQYEVEEGRALLEGDRGGKLPPVLKAALQHLLCNLQEYKPYLPDAMLVRESVDICSIEPPGLAADSCPVITICFTDVQSSTELWEQFPQGMHTALQLHNNTVRQEACACGGYEVKVIGDSFMLAFAGVEDACRFSLDTQAALADQRWPSDLMQHPLCTQQFDESGAMIWNGLRVRIGLNCGPVRVEKNPVTGRCDYFGPAVNTAARVEACLRHGGLTGVTRPTLDVLDPRGLHRLGDPVQVAMGPMTLKGVSEPVEVVVLLCRKQAEREAVLRHDGSQRSGRRSLSASVRSDLSGVRSELSTNERVSIGPLRSRGIREGLSMRAATCASFRAGNDSDLTALGAAVIDMLEAVEQAADATQGVVAGTLSVQCVVVWNGPRACSDHFHQCLHATDITRHRPIAAGASSSNVLYGNVAAGRKKHATVVGGCVELAAALAEGAQQCGEPVLAAGIFGRYCTTQRRAKRCAAWRVQGSDEWLSVWFITAPVEGASYLDPLPTFLLLEDGEAELQCPLDESGFSGRWVSLGAGFDNSS